MSTRLSVASDFSEFPFGRYPEHGPNNGKRFREELLAPALRKPGTVTVDLAGARGLAPSFLEEAFGGLVRMGFTYAELTDRLTVRSDVDPSLVADVWDYIREAAGVAATSH